MIVDPITASPLKRLAIKYVLENDFKKFIEHFFFFYFKAPFEFNWHHDEIINSLLDVFYGRTKRLIINIAPRYSKSIMVIILFTAWAYANNPGCEFLHLSYAESLALYNSDVIRQIIKLPEFQALWPVQTKDSQDSKQTWETTENGAFNARSFGGQITGKGAGKLNELDKDGNYKFSGCEIIDDPTKPDDTRSEVKTVTQNERWDTTIKSRLNSKTTPVIVVMQRLGVDDFVGYLLKREGEKTEITPEGEWTVLKFPCLYDNDTKALWDKKHNVDELLKLKKLNPFVFDAQYQQDPKRLQGIVFQDSDFQIYETAIIPEYMFLTADTAQKTEEYNDYSVLCAWGVFNSHLYLMSIQRGKWESPELINRVNGFWQEQKNFCYQNGISLQNFYIEDKSSGTGTIQTFKNTSIPVIAVQVHKDKWTRASDVLPYYRSGKYHIPMNENTLTIIDEHKKFTPLMTHKHDDIIDNFTMAGKIVFIDNDLDFYSGLAS